MFEPHCKVKIQGMSKASDVLGKRLVISAMYNKISYLLAV